MRPTAWAGLLLVVVAAFAGAQQIVIGGEVEAGVSLRGDLPGLDFAGAFSGGLGTALVLSPVLSVYGPEAELRARLSLRQEGGAAGGPGVSLDELRLRLYPSDRLIVELGRLQPRSGGALLFSPVNYLARLPLDALGSAEPAALAAARAAAEPVDALTARAFFGSSYASIALVPVPRPYGVPAAAAGLLDGLPLLATVTDPLIPGSPLERRSVVIGSTAALPDWRRISAAAELGVAAGPADLAFYAYQGLDPVPAVRAAILTGEAPDGEFDLELFVSEATITALGVAVQSVFGPFMVWADGSFAFGRTLGTTAVNPTEVSAGRRLTETERSPALDLVAGVAVDTARPAMTVAAEARYGFYFSPREDVIRLDLPGLLFTSAEFRLADGAVRAGLAGAILLADWSVALLPSFRLVPSAELELSIGAALLAGPQGSLLASVSSLSTFRAALAYRF